MLLNFKYISGPTVPARNWWIHMDGIVTSIFSLEVFYSWDQDLTRIRPWHLIWTVMSRSLQRICKTNAFPITKIFTISELWLYYKIKSKHKIIKHLKDKKHWSFKVIPQHNFIVALNLSIFFVVLFQLYFSDKWCFKQRMRGQLCDNCQDTGGGGDEGGGGVGGGEGGRVGGSILLPLLPGRIQPLSNPNIPKCGFLFNCHCENVFPDSHNNLQCSRFCYSIYSIKFSVCGHVTIVPWPLLSPLGLVFNNIYIYSCERFYHGACYNLMNNSYLWGGMEKDKGKLLFLV